MATKQKVIRAIVEFEDGQEIEYNNIGTCKLAHELIELSTPKLNMAITQAMKDRFIELAKTAFIKDRSGISIDHYVPLWVDKEVEKHFAIERCNHSFNEMVKAKIQKV